MAHTFVQKSQANAQSGDPISHDHTPGSAATICIVSIVVAGTTARTGGAPTIDGTTATQIESVQTGLETNVEMWYVAKSFSGALFSISIPNTNTVTCHVEAVTAYAGSGYTSSLTDSDAWAEANDTADAINQFIYPVAVGDFEYCRLGCGEAATGSVSEISTAPTKTLTYANDHGVYTSFGHYGIADGVTQDQFRYTWTNDDGAVIAAVFTAVVAGLDYTYSGTVSAELTLASTRQIEKIIVGDISGEITLASGWSYSQEVLDFLYTGAVSAECYFSSQRLIEKIIPGDISGEFTYQSARQIEKVIQGALSAEATFQAQRLIEKLVTGQISAEITLNSSRQIEKVVLGDIQGEVTFASGMSFVASALDYLYTGALSAEATFASQRLIEKIITGQIVAEASFASSYSVYESIWELVLRNSVSWTLVSKPTKTPVDGAYTEVGTDGAWTDTPPKYTPGAWTSTGDGWVPIFTPPITPAYSLVAKGSGISWSTISKPSVIWAIVSKPT